MPCLKAPQIPTPTLPGLTVGTPALSAGASTPAFSADLPCCVFVIPSVGIAVQFPPLGVTAGVLLGGLAQTIAQINAFVRSFEPSCPF